MSKTSMLLLAALVGACSPNDAPLHNPGRDDEREIGRALTHGIIAGDPSPSRVIVWARSDGPGTLHVEVDGPGGPFHTLASLEADDDFTARVRVAGLTAGTRYLYRVWVGDDGAGATGRFVTPPAPEDARPVQFVFGGELACRDPDAGYGVFEAMRGLEPEFFVGVGDMVRADEACGGTKATSTLEGFRAHWRATRDDLALRNLLGIAGYYATFDDHVAGVLEGEGVAANREAFLEHNPVDESSQLHRSFRWGKHLQLVLLDTRTHRDDNRAPDHEAEPKTMLGEAQRTWLVEQLLSDATWKVVVSSVPIAIPVGDEAARDGWASEGGVTGFEHELTSILAALGQSGAGNVVFLSGGAGSATVLRLRPFGPTGAVVHEIVTGPLATPRTVVDELDDTFAPERLFVHGLAAREPEGSAEADARPWLDFGSVEIDAAGAFHLTIHDIDGAVAWSTTLEPR